MVEVIGNSPSWLGFQHCLGEAALPVVLLELWVMRPGGWGWKKSVGTALRQMLGPICGMGR